MRILYASMMLPFPPTFGKRMEIWTTLRALAQAGHDVTLLSFRDEEQSDIDENVLFEVCREVILIPLKLSRPGSGRDYLDRIIALPDSAPHQAARYRCDLFRERVRQMTSADQFDAILCGEVFMLQNMPSELRVPVILKKDHLAATILWRFVVSERNPLRRIYGFIEWTKMRRWEPRVSRRASAIVACSELERHQLQNACPGIPVTMGPNVVDVPRWEDEDEEDGGTILYHGLMDWFPNQDAVTYFITDIFPQLRELVPNVRFVVAGRSSSTKFADRFAHLPGVEFTGTVPDMRVYIRQCAVCVVPLRIASGTRFKILEAAALGRPVVSTTIGAEGLSFANDREIILADEPAAFAHGVAGLLKDSALRRSMGRAARRRVECDYSFSRLVSALRETLALVVPSRTENEVPDLTHPSV